MGIHFPTPWPGRVGDINIKEMAVRGIQKLGRSGFYSHGGARLAGHRPAPPPLDPHRHREEMREKENGRTGIAAIATPPVPDVMGGKVSISNVAVNIGPFVRKL